MVSGIGTDCQLSGARDGEKGQMAKAEAKTSASTLLKRHCLFSRGSYAMSVKSGACYVPGMGCQIWGFANEQEHPPRFCLHGARPGSKH